MEIIKPAIGLVFWMVLSFSIVLFILAKFAWKPILKIIKDREHSIADALEQADRAREKLALMKIENERMINEVKIERDKVLRQAKEAAGNIISEAREKAKEEAAKVVKNSREAIQNEKQAAIIELKNQVASLSIEIAEKILKNELTDPMKQKLLINKLVENAQLN